MLHQVLQMTFTRSLCAEKKARQEHSAKIKMDALMQETAGSKTQYV